MEPITMSKEEAQTYRASALAEKLGISVEEAKEVKMNGFNIDKEINDDDGSI